MLWNLITAIYEREFSKSLQRQPVLLKGGWEAWEKYVGERGIERDGEERPSMPQRRESVDEFGRIEAKKANRKAAIVPASGGAVMRNSGGTVSVWPIWCSRSLWLTSRRLPADASWVALRFSDWVA